MDKTKLVPLPGAKVETYVDNLDTSEALIRIIKTSLSNKEPFVIETRVSKDAEFGTTGNFITAEGAATLINCEIVRETYNPEDYVIMTSDHDGNAQAINAGDIKNIIKSM